MKVAAFYETVHHLKDEVVDVTALSQVLMCRRYEEWHGILILDLQSKMDPDVAGRCLKAAEDDIWLLKGTIRGRRGT